MDLFVINRYEGEEKPNEEDEKNKLEKIITKIKKRKLAREKKKHRMNVKFGIEGQMKTIKNLKRKFKTGILTKEEASQAIKLKAVKLEDLAAKMGQGQELSYTQRMKAMMLIEDGIVQLKTEDETKKIEEEEKVDDGTKKKRKKKKIDKPAAAADEIVEKKDETIEPKIKKTKTKKVSPGDIEGFTILGVDNFAKKKQVKRVLPKWLRNPTIISSDLNNLTEKISRTDLNPKLKKKLKEKKIKYLFPVQSEFIPWELKTSKISGLIAPQDACISAPTGSGKTLAFTIPILESLQQQIDNHSLTIKAIRALIILPTQSLALQIYDTLKSLITGNEINIGLATGAGNRTLEQEQKQLITCNSIWGTFSKVDILVCTAGRLVDHLKSTKGFDLKHLQYLIIDEADRVLDSIQDDWLYHLGIHLREGVNRNIVNVETVKKRNDPQKLLFSATLSQDPEKLQKLSLFQPKLFTCISDKDNKSQEPERFVGKYTTPAELTEKYIICTIEIKPLILYKLIINEIDKNKKSRILVFVNTIDTLHRLNVLLKFMGQEKFQVAEFSSNQANLETRKHLLKNFEDGLLQVLVCTDSMARGIDIPHVDCVISYSTPNHLKTYIHRAGRTARAGLSGLCISMMHSKQQNTFLSMIENMRSEMKTIEEINIPSEDLEILTPLYETCLSQLKVKVHEDTEMSAMKMKTRKLAFNKRKNQKFRKEKFYKK